MEENPGDLLKGHPLFESKEQQRQARDRLPIEEKLAILVEMQKTARAIAIAAGRKPTPVWDESS